MLSIQETDLILLEAEYYVHYGFKDTAKALLLDAISSQVVSLKIYDTLIAMYLEEKNSSDFKDLFLTFSNQPKLQLLKGNLKS